MAAGPNPRGGRMIRWIRRWYGESPLHLLALLAAFGLAGYAVRAVIEAGQWRGFAEWFAAAVIGHDLLLFPLYTLADRSLRRLLPGRPGRRQRAGTGSQSAQAPAPAVPAPPGLNYVRVPAAFSLLLLAVFFPLILGLSRAQYHRAAGLATGPYLWRWLGITGVMFAVSAIAYALRARRAAARGHGRPAAAAPESRQRGQDPVQARPR